MGPRSKVKKKNGENGGRHRDDFDGDQDLAFDEGPDVENDEDRARPLAEGRVGVKGGLDDEEDEGEEGDDDGEEDEEDDGEDKGEVGVRVPVRLCCPLPLFLSIPHT
jgi:hypothetical protein